MATADPSHFFRRLARGMAAETLTDRPDRELVERFLAGHDESVFEALMRRHWPMVYRVCWRVLQHPQDAEDAFQATFLLLAQKLRSVRKRDSLASWLHGVAHRVALQARDQAARRRRHERLAAVAEAVPPDEITWKQVRTALDGELTRLPERLRLPLILCYLEGHTQDEAAQRLGWSKSTLVRRLQDARAALGRRLRRKGFVWPAAVSGVLLCDCLAPALPAHGIISTTVEAAACLAAGRTVATGLISNKAAALAQGAVQAMFLKNLAVAVLLLATVCLGAGVLLCRTLAQDPQPVVKSPKQAQTQGRSQPVPKIHRPGNFAPCP
jgi:RNA polymerase sigma factor (sigma-70 family)